MSAITREPSLLSLVYYVFIQSDAKASLDSEW